MPTFSWLPQPLLSLALWLIWLSLVNNFTFGQVLLGALLGMLIPLFSQAFWPNRLRIVKPWVLLKFMSRLLIDIVIANLVVARLILFQRPGSHRARFVQLPLDLNNEFAITMLAGAISLTPGTVSSDVDQERRYLLIHCLDVEDEAALVAQIKTRYEAPLKEVFESC